MSWMDRLFDPQFVGAILAGIAVFATVITVAAPMLQKDRLAGRLKAVADQREVLRRRQMEELNKKANIRGQQVDFMKRTIDQLKLQNLLETPGIREKLNAAGYRGQGPVYAFLFFRFAMPFVLLGIAGVYFFVISKSEMPTFNKVIFTFGAGALGFYVPDLYVKNVAQKRQESIMRAFPDALDLLLICVESGMAIEPAMQRVAREIGAVSVPLAEEMTLTVAELSFLSDRRRAFENLGKRTGLPQVKSVVTSLIQSERYGTPLGTALRVLAQENRDMRMAEAERRAAALPPRLTVPMMMFFMPVILVVVMGPAVIQAVQFM